MKKIAAAAALAVMMPVITANAAYTQHDIQTAAERAFAWQEENASPRNAAGSFASDYYIMSLARMGKSYDYDAYTKLTDKLNPSTVQDGQRLIMTTSVCGGRMSDSFVGIYTWQRENSSASELASAIITLDSGGYDVPDSEGGINRLAGTLLSTQQSDGSFGNDIVTTAKAVIALSPRLNTEYQMAGAHDDELYKYNTNSAVENALAFLSASQRGDGGYSTISNTAYVVAALDSIGIDADSSQAFTKDGATPLSFLMAQQDSNGSIASSADDTALLSMAYVSHLRAMQGKAGFFRFTSGDSVDAVSPAAAENRAGNGAVSPKGAVSGSAETGATEAPKEIISVAAPPTKEPEHSAVSEEEYGPFQFVGPIRRTEQPQQQPAEPRDDGETEPTSGGKFAVILLAAAAAAALAGFILLTVIRRNPKLQKALGEALAAAKAKLPFKTETGLTEKTEPETSEEPAVPLEKLYDPDFVKTLIPVDEIDGSIDSLLTEDEPKETASETNT